MENPNLSKRESLTITRKAYELLSLRKQEMNQQGIPANLGSIASELIVKNFGLNNGQKVD